MQALRSIVRAEGFRGLFVGGKEQLMREIPFNAVQFAVYEVGWFFFFGLPPPLRLPPPDKSLGRSCETLKAYLGAQLQRRVRRDIPSVRLCSKRLDPLAISAGSWEARS